MKRGWVGLEDVKKNLSGPCFEDHRGLSVKGMLSFITVNLINQDVINYSVDCAFN